MGVDKATTEARNVHDPMNVDQTNFGRGILLATCCHTGTDLAGNPMGLLGDLSGATLDVHIHLDHGGGICNTGPFGSVITV